MGKVKRKRVREMRQQLMRSSTEMAFCKAKLRQPGKTTNDAWRHIFLLAGCRDTAEATALFRVMNCPELLDRDTDYRTIDDE